jgi:uncharacterized protein YdaU (DUF1376 family)
VSSGRKKSPAYSRYPKDFLADTQLLSTEQVGAYQLLLDSAWIGLPGMEQGFLPDDDEALARLARLPLARWRRIGAPVRALFRANGEGALFHKRLLEELARQQARSSKASESATRRWESGARGEHSSERNSAPLAMRTHSEGNAIKAAAAANADEEADSVLGGEGEREGERSASFDPTPYLAAVLGLYPRHRVPLPGDGRERGPWRDDLVAALVDVGAELPDPLDFACRLFAWTESEDWREKGGRYVPPADRYVRRGDWAKEPRRPREADEAYRDELRAAIAACGAALEEAA